jgi:putative peptide zinc metalloprotease protein
VYKALQPHGLQALGVLLGLAAIVAAAVAPLSGAWRWWSNPAARRAFRPVRAAWGGLACVLLAAGLLCIPFPHSIVAPVVLQPQQARYVYVAVSGRLAEAVRTGRYVAKDQPLARLVNLDIASELAELDLQRRQQHERLANLKLRLADDPSLASQIPVAEETLAGIEARFRQRQRDQEQLVPRAPQAGTVIPAPRQAEQPFGSAALPTWHGDPLQPRNVGANLESGTLLCLVGDPRRLEAVLVVDQGDVEFVRRGQTVRLKLDQIPGRVARGTVTELSKIDLKVAPRELARAAGLAVHVDRAGIPHPAGTSYQARVSLEDYPEGLLAGARGQAKVLAASESLGSRFARHLSRFARFLL